MILSKHHLLTMESAHHAHQQPLEFQEAKKIEEMFSDEGIVLRRIMNRQDLSLGIYILL